MANLKKLLNKLKFKAYMEQFETWLFNHNNVIYSRTLINRP